jgi:peptidylprolyl isomerase
MRGLTMAAALGLTLGLAVAPGMSLAFAKKTKPAPAKVAPAVAAPTTNDWVEINPENVLVIDTSKGRIYVEMMPQVAPEHVARIRLLTRQRFYDGLKFHRVIDNFMAQTGDPLGTGEGQSPYPDVKAEFSFRRDETIAYAPVVRPAGVTIGFLGAFPIETQPDDMLDKTADHKVAGWGLYCQGVAGMARDDAENSANSQFFLMRQPYPSLEKRYTAWGRVVSGLDVVRAIKVGEPVVDPDVMTKVQVLADLPEGSRPKVVPGDRRQGEGRQGRRLLRVRRGRARPDQVSHSIRGSGRSPG